MRSLFFHVSSSSRLSFFRKNFIRQHQHGKMQLTALSWSPAPWSPHSEYEGSRDRVHAHGPSRMCVLPASLWSQAPFLPGLWTHLGAFESGFMQEMCIELNGNTCKLGPRPISTHRTPTHPSSGPSQAGLVTSLWF